MEIQAARAIGGAGTGKTTMLLQIAERAMERPEIGGNPLALGFSSFTRAARGEAAGRAAAAWGMKQSELERDGWFRTCHSVAYRQLGVSKGEIVGDSREDVEWLSNAVGAEVHTETAEEDGASTVYVGDREAAAALNYWSRARSMVVPLRAVVDADEGRENPGFGIVARYVEAYEQAKRLDGRSDFTDLLSRFVGVHHDSEHGPTECAPEGAVPDSVVGWIFDEAQDASRLLDMACRRLVTGESCRWAWLVLDPFQVIYGWSGSSSEHAMSWPVAKQKIMPKSYRCGRGILEFGEACLRRMHRGYWDRGIAPADHVGEVVESDSIEDEIAGLDPSVDTLVIARANYQVRSLSAMLHKAGIPFRRVKAKQGALHRDVGLTGLWKLQHDEIVDRAEWTQAIDLLPSRTPDGRTWLVRGSKARWTKELSAKFDKLFASDLEALGATEHLRAAIASGAWSGLCDGGQAWVKSVQRNGLDVTCNPRVRVGTIHSVKGQEASKVVLLSSVGKRITEGQLADDERHDEERRVEYVACTRAKHQLIVAHDPREPYRMDLFGR